MARADYLIYLMLNLYNLTLKMMAQYSYETSVSAHQRCEHLETYNVLVYMPFLEHHRHQSSPGPSVAFYHLTVRNKAQLRRVMSSDIWRHIVLCKSTDASENMSPQLSWYKNVPSKKPEKERESRRQVELIFRPSGAGDMFLQNIGWFSKDYKTLYPKR